MKSVDDAIFSNQKGWKSGVETADGNSSFSAPSFLIPSNWRSLLTMGSLIFFSYRAARDLYPPGAFLRTSAPETGPPREIVSRIGGSERARRGNGGQRSIQRGLRLLLEPVNRTECANYKFRGKGEKREERKKEEVNSLG